MRRAYLLPLVGLAAFVMSACGASDGSSPGGSGTGTVASPVINGVFDDGTTHDSVIAIQTDLGGGRAAGCSGTLVSSNVIVTARHCVSRIDDVTKAVYEDYDPTKMYVWLGNSPRGSPDGTVAKIVHNSSTTLYDNDIALLVLTGPIGKMTSPMRLAGPPIKYETVMVVGYGLTTADTGTSSGMHLRNRRQNLKIESVGPVTAYGLGGNEILLGESICSGDSGGPVFDQATGALLAVTSRGGNGAKPTSTQPWAACVGGSTVNFFTRVDGFADLIKSTITDAGGTPWEEGDPKPVGPTPPPAGSLGALCVGPSDCESKVCVAWGGKNVCSAACSDTAPCPTGFDCLSGYCIASDGTTPPPDPTPDAGANADPGTSSKGHCSVSHAGSSPLERGESLFLLAGLAGLAVFARRRDRSR